MRASRRFAGLLLVVVTVAQVVLVAAGPAAAGGARAVAGRSARSVLPGAEPVGAPAASDGSGPAPSVRAREAETSWPPALVYFVVFVALGALGAVGTVFWRAHRTLRPRR